jgi:outer membrane protein assembly factor BamA
MLKFTTIIYMFVLSGFFLISGSFASSPEDITSEKDSASLKKTGFIFIPAVFYTPETKIAGGASALFYFRNSGSASDKRPSTINPTVIYTQRKQMILQLTWELYMKNGLYRLNGNAVYMKYPDKFYGIGPNTIQSMEESFTPRNAIVQIILRRKLMESIYAGVLYHFQDTKLQEIDPDGALAQKLIPGSSGGTVSGTGVMFDWDNRDNIFYSTSGGYFEFVAAFARKAIGSDFIFNQYNLDLRHFISITNAQVLAIQGYASLLNGNVPFQSMSKVGGASLLRGYYEGRYRDKNLAMIQAEYRFMPWQRFGFTAFAGLGDVSDRISHFELDRLKYSVGGGFRYVFNPEEKLNLRVDLAYGKNTSGLYLTIGEAF